MTQPPAVAPRGDLVRAAILGLLGTRGPSSRAEVARVLDVSPATVTQTVKDLLARRLVTELESVPSRGGRPARLLGLVENAGGALGAKVTADHVTTVAVGLDGTVQTSATDPFDATHPQALDRLCTILTAHVTSQPSRLLGVGVGVPGTVDALASGVVDAPTLDWNAVPVGPRLRERLGLPVIVDNDVNALAAAESVYGLGRHHSTYLVVTIGRGVGCGVVDHGTVARGAHGGAGEIGHIPVTDDGPACGCGNRGCLEAYVGELGLMRAALEQGVFADARDTSPAALRSAAAGGDARVLTIYRDAGSMLGRALAGVVHVIDPEVVVIMGEGIDAWQFWEDGFEQSLRRHLMPARQGLRCHVEPWTEDQWARGAASLVLASPFDSTGAAGDQGVLVRTRLQSTELAVTS